MRRRESFLYSQDTSENVAIVISDCRHILWQNDSREIIHIFDCRWWLNNLGPILGNTTFSKVYFSRGKINFTTTEKGCIVIFVHVGLQPTGTYVIDNHYSAIHMQMIMRVIICVSFALQFQFQLHFYWSLPLSSSGFNGDLLVVIETDYHVMSAMRHLKGCDRAQNLNHEIKLNADPVVTSKHSSPNAKCHVDCLWTLF